MVDDHSIDPFSFPAFTHYGFLRVRLEVSVSERNKNMQGIALGWKSPFPRVLARSWHMKVKS